MPKYCPSCNYHELKEEGANALSRKDNTEICSACGVREAMLDTLKELRELELEEKK